MSLSENAGGRHILIESFGGHARLDGEALKRLMRRAARAGGANVLSCHMHGFGKDGGVTGVALLAESHITVHTWPERSYAAFDVFMCGNCDADRAADVIAQAVPEARLAVRALDRPAPGLPGEPSRHPHLDVRVGLDLAADVNLDEQKAAGS